MVGISTTYKKEMQLVDIQNNKKDNHYEFEIEHNQNSEDYEDQGHIRKIFESFLLIYS